MWLPLLGKNCISQALQKIKTIAQIATPGSHNRRRWASSIRPNLGPSARYLAWACAKLKIWFYSGSCLYLVRTVYHQPAENLKLFPDRDPGRHNKRPQTRKHCPNLGPSFRILVWYNRKGMLPMLCENWTPQWRQKSNYRTPTCPDWNISDLNNQ